MHKIFFSLFLFNGLISFGQVLKSDSLVLPVDSLKPKEEMYEKAVPVVFDTLSYAEEYKRDVWRTQFGIRGGVSRGRFRINEGIVDQVSTSGLPVLDANGKVVKGRFVNNAVFSTGFDAALFFRFVRGSFFLQPELVYSSKAGIFDVLKADGSLSNRVNARINSIDVPVLIGIRFKNARVFFGPSTNFAFQMNKEMKSILSAYSSEENLDADFFNRPNLNFNVGLAFEFKAFFFETRFEKGLNTYTNQNIGPANSPHGFRIFADGFHFSLGFINR
jgi:hypothetical protein